MSNASDRENPPLALYNRRRAWIALAFAVASLGVTLAFYRWFAGYAVAVASLPLALFMPAAPTARDARSS